MSGIDFSHFGVCIYIYIWGGGLPLFPRGAFISFQQCTDYLALVFPLLLIPRGGCFHAVWLGSGGL